MFTIACDTYIGGDVMEYAEELGFRVSLIGTRVHEFVRIEQ